MKFAKIALTATALFASSVALAGTLSSSSNITFLAFDGQKVKNKKKQELQVNESKLHQVVVEVSSLYKSGNESTFFESTPIILTFNGTQEDIKITAPNLRSELDVETFKEKPSFKIETASGKMLEFKQDYLKGEGFMPNSRIVENLANYNASEGIAAVKHFAQPSTPAVMPTGNGKATKGKVMVQGENIAEQQLQYWFQQADKATQKRFLDWAKKQ